eukprot:Blabericola_migrator_1__4174@NODE_2277_length_3014_cov_43_568375_g1432_i0_p1_GENE_NODE_2277_length_3014_cov_43_568375_g1432_i0NODE_2277_length_3014_cov_43_568375_g1432_i0_p1_ORF_typecomplete_len421_score58_22_NODE_2277_length_3014_cov_43_568375_g1432_i0601322
MFRFLTVDHSTPRGLTGFEVLEMAISLVDGIWASTGSEDLEATWAVLLDCKATRIPDKFMRTKFLNASSLPQDMGKECRDCLRGFTQIETCGIVAAAIARALQDRPINEAAASVKAEVSDDLVADSRSQRGADESLSDSNVISSRTGHLDALNQASSRRPVEFHIEELFRSYFAGKNSLDSTLFKVSSLLKGLPFTANMPLEVKAKLPELLRETFGSVFEQRRPAKLRFPRLIEEPVVRMPSVTNFDRSLRHGIVLWRAYHVFCNSVGESIAPFMRKQMTEHTVNLVKLLVGERISDSVFKSRTKQIGDFIWMCAGASTEKVAVATDFVTELHQKVEVDETLTLSLLMRFHEWTKEHEVSETEKNGIRALPEGLAKTCLQALLSLECSKGAFRIEYAAKTSHTAVTDVDIPEISCQERLM